jgi:hypothetical protein
MQQAAVRNKNFVHLLSTFILRGGAIRDRKSRDKRDTSIVMKCGILYHHIYGGDEVGLP